MDKNLDFEINFFESLLVRKPDFCQALVALGEAYTRKGMYDRGLEVDLRLLKLRPLDEVAYYNLACDYSLLQDNRNCLRALEKSLVLGYRDFRLMENDADLSFVKNDPRFWELLEKYRLRKKRVFRPVRIPSY